MELETYTHYFSLNFEYRSNLEGTTDKEAEQLQKEATNYLKTLVETNGGCLDWRGTVFTKDVIEND